MTRTIRWTQHAADEFQRSVLYPDPGSARVSRPRRHNVDRRSCDCRRNPRLQAFSRQFVDLTLTVTTSTAGLRNDER